MEQKFKRKKEIKKHCTLVLSSEDGEISIHEFDSMYHYIPLDSYSVIFNGQTYVVRGNEKSRITAGYVLCLDKHDVSISVSLMHKLRLQVLKDNIKHFSEWIDEAETKVANFNPKFKLDIK